MRTASVWVLVWGLSLEFRDPGWDELIDIKTHSKKKLC